MSNNPDRRRRVAAVGVVGLVAGLLTTAGTISGYTDRDQIDGNTFTAGFLDLTVTPQSMALTAENMAPGDEVSRVITVLNSGTVPLTYDITLGQEAGHGTLAEVLDVSVHDADSVGEASEGNRILYQEGLDSADATAGPSESRELRAGESEDLVLHAQMQLGADTSYADDSAVLEFTFDAVQDAETRFIQGLMDDPVSEVIQALAFNPAAPEWVVEELLPFDPDSGGWMDPNETSMFEDDISLRAAEILHDNGYMTLSTSIMNTSNPDLMQWAYDLGGVYDAELLFNDATPGDMTAAVGDRYLDSVDVGSLSTDITGSPGQSVLRAVARGGLSEGAVIKLAEEASLSYLQQGMSDLALQYPDLPSSVMDALLSRAMDSVGWQDLPVWSMHPAVTIDIDWAAEQGGFVNLGLMQGYAANPSITPAQLEDLRERSWNPAVTAIYNPSVDEETLYEIVSNPNGGNGYVYSSFSGVTGWWQSDSLSARVIEEVMSWDSVPGGAYMMVASPNAPTHVKAAHWHRAEVAQSMSLSDAELDQYIAEREQEMYPSYTNILHNQLLTPGQLDTIMEFTSLSGLYPLIQTDRLTDSMIRDMESTSQGRIDLAGGKQISREILREMAVSDNRDERIMAAKHPFLF